MNVVLKEVKRLKEGIEIALYMQQAILACLQQTELL